MDSISVDVDVSKVIAGFNALEWEKAMQKKDRKRIFSKAANVVKRAVVQAVKRTIPNDPRKSYQAVRVIVWKDGNGAKTTIKSGGKGAKFFVRVKALGGASGIRRHRKISARTEQVESYFGRDRAFILNWQNTGTNQRNTKFGNRGTITAKNFFRQASDSVLPTAKEVIKDGISQHIISAAREAGFVVRKG